MGLVLDFPFFRVAKLSVGSTGEISPGPRPGAMLLVLDGFRHIRFGGWRTGIWLGNRFLDTYHRPIYTDLDFTWLPLAFRPSFLGVGLIAWAGLTPMLLAYCPLTFLTFVWMPSTFYLARCHFRTGCPFTFFLGGQGTVPQLVKGRCPSGSGLSSWCSSWGGSQASLEAFQDCGVGCHVNRRAVSFIHLRRPGEPLQDLHRGGHNPSGNSGGQFWGGNGPAGSRSYVVWVWASGSHTKTSHLHGGISVSMCAPGRAQSLSGLIRVRRW